MIFVWAKNVEILHADDPIQPTFTLRVLVEQMFGVSIHVQRAQPAEIWILVIHTLGAIAVGRGGGRVDKADVFR